MFKNKKFELIYSTCTGSRTLPYSGVQKFSIHQDRSIRTVHYRMVRYHTDTNLFNLIFFQKIDTMVLHTSVQYRTEIFPINHCSCMHFVIFLLNFVCMYCIHERMLMYVHIEFHFIFIQVCLQN